MAAPIQVHQQGVLQGFHLHLARTQRFSLGGTGKCSVWHFVCVCKHLYATGHVSMVVYSHSEGRRDSSNCLGEKGFQYVFRGGIQMRSELWKPSPKDSWDCAAKPEFSFFCWYPENRRIISCCLFYLHYLQKGIAELILSLACCKEYSWQVNNDICNNNYLSLLQNLRSSFQKDRRAAEPWAQILALQWEQRGKSQKLFGFYPIKIYTATA